MWGWNLLVGTDPGVAVEVTIGTDLGEETDLRGGVRPQQAEAELACPQEQRDRHIMGAGVELRAGGMQTQKSVSGPKDILGEWAGNHWAPRAVWWA